jgi:hypothetical protein
MLHQLVVEVRNAQATRNHSTNVRYASACRRPHQHSTNIGIRHRFSFALSVKSVGDKLKRIGHSLSGFYQVACIESRRQAEAYRTFVEWFLSGDVYRESATS